MGSPSIPIAYFEQTSVWTIETGFWGLSLTGVDSMDILPDRKDPGETNAYNIAYKGWRNTSGMNWQHIFSKNSFGVASLANSEQSQSLVENAQMLSGANSLFGRHEGWHHDGEVRRDVAGKAMAYYYRGCSDCGRSAELYSGPATGTAKSI